MGKPEKEDLVLRELRCTHRESRDKASGPGSQLSHLEPSGQFPRLSLGMSAHLFPPHDWSEARTCVRAHVCVDTAHSTTVECHLFTDVLFLPFQHFWTLLTGRIKGGGCGFNQESWTVVSGQSFRKPKCQTHGTGREWTVLPARGLRWASRVEGGHAFHRPPQLCPSIQHLPDRVDEQPRDHKGQPPL